MKHWLHRRLREDSGVTLVELSIAMVLMAVVGSLVAGAVVGTHRLVRTTDDQTQGLQDVRVAAERVVRDIRDSRAVLCNPTGTDAALAAADPNCTYHLQLWIDYNANYKLDSGETVTWRLRCADSSGTCTSGHSHYDFVRAVDGGNQMIEAHTIVEQVAFSYDYPPGATEPAAAAAHTSEVNVNMTYDALLQNGAGSKTTTFSARIRNVR